MRSHIQRIFAETEHVLVQDCKGNRRCNPIAWRKDLAELGITRLDLPDYAGGLNCDALEMINFFALFGRFSLDLRDVPGIGHFGAIKCLRGRSKKNLLEAVKEATSFAAVAITEESGGSDLHNLQTKARPSGQQYEISGSKRYISRLQEASHVVVFCQTPRGGLQSNLTAFLLDLPNQEIEIEVIPSVGIRGVSWGAAHFQKVLVDRARRLGGEGEGFRIFRQHFSYWRLMMAAAAVGSSRALVEMCVSRLKDRQAFGSPIGRFTHLQQELAVAAARVHQAWLMVEYTARKLAAGHNCYYDAAMCKAEAVEHALQVATWATHIFAAEGYEAESEVERRFRDLRGLRIADGTTEVLRGQVARGLLGDELYEMALGRHRADALHSMNLNGQLRSAS